MAHTGIQAGRGVASAGSTHGRACDCRIRSAGRESPRRGLAPPSNVIKAAEPGGAPVLEASPEQECSPQERGPHMCCPGPHSCRRAPSGAPAGSAQPVSCGCRFSFCSFCCWFQSRRPEKVGHFVNTDGKNRPVSAPVSSQSHQSGMGTNQLENRRRK